MSDDVIFHYTRHMAFADGMLVDASQGELGPVSREHFPDHGLALTSAVFALVEAAVETGDGASLAGAWHDVLWMAHVCPVQFLPGGHTFKVGLLQATHLHWHELKIIFHGGDHGEPCATVMLPDED